MSQILNESLPSATGLYVGEIRLLPFRHNALPAGWYFCNGERFLFTSPQGEVLNSLSDDFRTDWGMEEDLCSISLPNLFHEDGRGCFFRPVDGVKRQVGATEGDAIRNITGDTCRDGGWSSGTGAFYSTGTTSSRAHGAATGASDLLFDASRVVPTAEENRPLNVGMTPAIYLGV